MCALGLAKHVGAPLAHAFQLRSHTQAQGGPTRTFFAAGSEGLWQHFSKTPAARRHLYEVWVREPACSVPPEHIRPRHPAKEAFLCLVGLSLVRQSWAAIAILR